MSPLITIGIPCYNASAWIGAAVESALAQTWPNIEVIVVDDGSTDDSGKILQTFGERIQLHRTNNRGVNRARNEILRLARGEWIQYLDADDYLLPDKITRQLHEADFKDEVGAIYSPVFVEKWSEGKAQPLVVEELNTNYDIYAQWIAWQLPQTSGSLWKREVMLRLGGWDENEKVCDEHELYLRALKQGVPFRFSPAPGAVYRHWSSDTRCHKDPSVTIASRTKLIDDMRQWLEDTGRWSESYRKVAGQACLEMSRTLADYDLADAQRYHRERDQHGLIELSGPAARPFYRCAYRTVGFAGAERIVRMLR